MFGDRMLKLLASLEAKLARQRAVLEVTESQIVALKQAIEIQRNKDQVELPLATPAREKGK